jgi:translocation and assembly module TamB
LAVALWHGLDRLAANVYGSQRHRLEKLVASAMGQPLQLGRYRGLRPLGLAAGASRFVATDLNRSTINAEAVEVSFDPLASLLQRAWVLQIRVLRPTVALRRNATGAFWTLPEQDNNREPPRLGLRIQVPQTAEVVLHAQGGVALPFRLRGSTDLSLWNRQMGLRGWIDPHQGGHLPFQMQANWQEQRWQLTLQPRQLPLAPVLPLLPPGVQAQVVGRLDGRLNGRLIWQRQAASSRCQGALAASALRWRPPAADQPLQADRLDLRCRDQKLLLSPAALRWGPWRGRAEGSVDLAAPAVALQLQARDAKPGHRLQAALQGPWQQPQLTLSADWRGVRWGQQPALPISLNASVAIDQRRELQLQLSQLQLRRGGARLAFQGSLWPQLDLRSSALVIGPELQPQLSPWLGTASMPEARLQQRGGWEKPQLQLQLQQSDNPLLGPWHALLQWRLGHLDLTGLHSPVLQASGQLELPARPMALQLNLDVQRFPLQRLSALSGVPLAGDLDARGRFSGSLSSLNADLQIALENPAVGPLLLTEHWQGSLRGGGAAGASLVLQPLAPAAPGLLQAQLDQRWLPRTVQWQRGEGTLALEGDRRGYRWQADRFGLAGWQVALGPSGFHQPLLGHLGGTGQLSLQPLAAMADVAIDRPALLGIAGSSLSASGSWRQGRLDLQALWSGERQDTISAHLKGAPSGPLWARFEARRFAADALRQWLLATQQLRQAPVRPTGSAQDLAGLAIDTFGLSLGEQLALLQQAQRALALRASAEQGTTGLLDPSQMQGLLNADLTVMGPAPDRLFLDLEANGHLWLRGQDHDQRISEQPMRITLRGPLAEASTFSIEHLPLALLALLAPVPDGLRGGLAAQGRVRFAQGRRRPELELSLALQDASLAGRVLALERGEVSLADAVLNLDASLRSAGAENSVDLKGSVPLDPAQDGIELRMASRGDGLRFLTVLGGEGVRWSRGSADLQLLVRGSLQAPLANGFLRFSDGVLEVAGQTLHDLDATVLFDFRELDLQQLTAKVGKQGLITGGGLLGLIQPLASQARPLRLTLQQVPFKVPRMQAQADGEVLLAGSLRQLDLSGELQLSRGNLNIQPGQLATEADVPQPVTVRELVEESWDFTKPLLVMGQQVEGSASRDLRAAVPNLPFLRFDALRVRFGPELRIGVPNVLSFSSGGLITLRGALDPSLQLSGVVRLLQGRLNLFTSSFSLDPDAPNVAVFTPSMGLIPYVDVALRTRVSDSLASNETTPADLYERNLASPFETIDQLRLVKVRVEAAGPADRLGDNIRITSAPPLPQERLLALIGGNSLVGLAGANAGAALATVLGQSLLSPLVGGLSDAFDQRLTFALYPTFVAPAETLAREERARQVPSQLVLGSEIGVDLTDRFNFSVLAVPNRSDIPTQATLRYQISEPLGVQTSVDAERRWQSQLQLLLRF